MSTEESFRLRPKQSPTTGRALKLFSYFAGLVTFIATLALVVVAITIAVAALPNTEWFTAVRYGLFVASGFIVFVAAKAFGYFNRWGKRHLATFADDVLAKDSRPAILYLRSFADDEAVYREEEEFVQVLNTWGPVVAIGRPGESLPPLGASRFYVADSDWQAFVSNLMRKSRLVFILAGKTPGLTWELQECRALIEPQRLIVIVPRDRTAYETFRTTAKAATDLKLPEFPVPPERERHACRWLGVIMFNADWVASYVPVRIPERKEYAAYEAFGAEYAWRAKFRNVLHPVASAVGLTSAPLPPHPSSGSVRWSRFFNWIVIVGLIFWVLIQLLRH